MVKTDTADTKDQCNGGKSSIEAKFCRDMKSL